VIAIAIAKEIPDAEEPIFNQIKIVSKSLSFFLYKFGINELH